MKAFGRIDMLVNNAGMSAHANFDEVNDLSWYETLMRINHWGSVWCTHAGAAAPEGAAAGASSRWPASRVWSGAGAHRRTAAPSSR
jgi:NAD(P)-dependent dehydrogenase (short-subunit alcohol dehydrogenase family)